MSCLGGFGPFPRRFGASSGRALEAILNSILSSLGTAYDTSPGTAVWVKAMALARAIWAAHEQNRKLGNQFDPQRVTDMLPRWEAIFGINPAPGATVVDRRAELTRRWKRIGRMPVLGNVIKTLQEIAPNTFASLVFTSSSASGVQTNTYVAVDISPQGGINVVGTGMWGSSVHHVAIKTTCPSWMKVNGLPGPAFYTEVGGIFGVLKNMLPSWVTFGWFLDDPHSDGTGVGFFLDRANNLDNERFRL